MNPRSPIAVENTVDDAEHVILLAVQTGIEYALGHGIDVPLVKLAALKAADFLRCFGAPPELKVVCPPGTQPRLLLEYRP